MLKKAEAYIWLGVGAAFVVAGEWVDWTVLDILGVRFNLGWLAVLYGFLLALRNAILKPHLVVTERELHDYGDKLVALTPQMIQWLEQGDKPRVVADRVEKAQQIPPLVTLKYIIAMGNYRKPRKPTP
jgi:hypothetical protein